MSKSFNPYKYKSIKDVENHLGDDLIDILNNIEKTGYVIQEQFEKLDAYFCENYANDIAKVISDKMGREIKYIFVTSCCFFAFYDPEIINDDNVIDNTNKFSCRKK